MHIDILVAVAEDEARRISERTKAALAAYKARGGKLGAARPECRNKLSDEARQHGTLAGTQAVKQQATAAYYDVAETIVKLRSAGCTLQDIAKLLNKQGHLSRAGKPWTDVAVLRVGRRSA